MNRAARRLLSPTYRCKPADDVAAVPTGDKVKKHLSKKSRDRLLRLATLFDRAAARIRRYVGHRTPRRGPRRKAEAA